MNRVIFFLLSSPVLLSSFRPHIHYNNQARDIKMSDDEFAQWLSGFTDAEVNFYILIPKNNVISFRFKIKLHLDDKDALVFIQSRLKCGNIITAQGKSYASFELTRIADIQAILIPLFDKFPLIGTKYLDYLALKKAIDIKFDQSLSKSDKLDLITAVKNSMNNKREDFIKPSHTLSKITPN